MGVSITPPVRYAVCIHNGTAWPPRPAAEVVLWIGPSEPTGLWSGQDEWVDNS